MKQTILVKKKMSRIKQQIQSNTKKQNWNLTMRPKELRGAAQSPVTK